MAAEKSWVEEYLEYCLPRVERVEECELWTGPVNQAGYAVARKMMGTEFVHKSLWQLEHGLLKPGVTLRNWCGKRNCVKSGHWRVVHPKGE